MNHRKLSLSTSLNLMSKQSLESFKQEQVGSKDSDNSFPYVGKAILPYAGQTDRLDIFSFARGNSKFFSNNFKNNSKYS